MSIKYTDIPNEYIILEEALNITGFAEPKFKSVALEFGIPSISGYYDGHYRNLYSKASVLKYKASLDEFWDKHIIMAKAKQIYSKPAIQNATKVPVSKYFVNVTNNIKFAYNLDELNMLSKTYPRKTKDYSNIIKKSDDSIDEQFLLNNCFVKEESMNLINLDRKTFEQVVKEYDIEIIQHKRKNFYSQNDINKILELQKEFIENAITYSEAYELYGAGAVINAEHYPLPTYAKGIDKFYNIIVYLKIDELDIYSKTKKSIDSTASTPFDTYILRLNMQNFIGFDKNHYTEKKWSQFIDNRLKNMHGSKKTVNKYINLYVFCAHKLAQFLNENKRKDKNRDIYAFSSTEINLFINGLTIEQGAVIYYFIKDVAEDIYFKKSNLKSRGFDFKKIKNPDKERRKKRSKDVNDIMEDIYTFDEYVEICTFVKNINYHLNKLLLIDTTLEKIKYLSTWLFSAIHISNGWRKSDICEFPCLEVDDLLKEEKIDNLNWFYNNKITLNISRLVILKIKKYYYYISKTTGQNEFYTSDELGQVITTIIFMLETLYQNNNIVRDEHNNKIMFFDNTYNDLYTDRISNFFEDIEVSTAKFNIKMTKTILSFSTAIAPIMNDIFVAKEQRGHFKLDSTIYYIRLPQEQLEFLSKQLFDRGEFGYIYDKLIDIVYNNKNKKELLQERTDLIQIVKTTFGDELKLSSTLKLTNYYNQIDILNILYESGLEECTVTLNNIYFNSLPSKEDYIQCLCSNSGCLCPERGLYPDKDGCIGCKFSIPNIYALTVLGDRLKKDFNDYFSTSNKIKQRKLSMRIHRYKDVVKQALNKFDKDYVYSCLGIDLSRSEFLENMKSINSPDEIFENIYKKLE